MGIDLDSIEMTDEHGTEWVRIDYEYECPIDNYLDGEETETIQTVYIGPKKLFFYANNETGAFESVHREWEIPPESDPEMRAWDGYTLIEFNAEDDPLVAEVLSDYHNNFMDADDYVHEVGSKQIETPEGYECFEYPYPIHPDELYDDKKSVWNFETNKVELYKNTNLDIIGEAPTWETIRKERNVLLRNSDTLFLTFQAMGDSMADQLAEIELYRQRLRDFPAVMEEAGIPLIFMDSCWPKTTLIEYPV